jgi:peptidoglycan L-alanyl-D-glutamate endopeptidase CwlK
MRDKQSIVRVKNLHPSVSAEVEGIIDAIEAEWPPTIAVRITQGLRTIDEQNALYAKGRTTAGPIVTNAKGGSSYHNYGLAVDFALLHDKDGNGTFEEIDWNMNTDWDGDHIKDWSEVVNAFLAAGWVWGGNWKSLKDNPHFEKTMGNNWRDLLVKYNNEQFIPNTKYVVV